MRTCRGVYHVGPRTLPESQFYKRTGGKYFLSECKACWHLRTNGKSAKLTNRRIELIVRLDRERAEAEARQDAAELARVADEYRRLGMRRMAAEVLG